MNNKKIILLLALAIFTCLIISCSDIKDMETWDNPVDPSGTNWVPPEVTAMEDTTVSINDSFYIHAEAEDENGTIEMFYWSFDEETFTDSTVENRVKTAFSDSGEKLVRIYVADNDGAPSEIDSIIITVLLNPPQVSGMHDDTVSVKDTITITAEGIDHNGTIEKYYWALDGVNFDDSTGKGSIEKVFLDSGAHMILVKARDDDGVFSETEEIMLTVDLNAPSVRMGDDLVVSIKDTVMVTAEASDTNGYIVNYLWAFDNNDFTDTTEIGEFKLWYPDTGLYLVKVKVSDEDSIFSNIDSVHIQVITDPPVIYHLSDTAVAVNDTITFISSCSDEYGSVLQYLWSLDGEYFTDSTDTNFFQTTFGDSG
ncbi:PKD domain-containing protein, partial [Fibrobacterota bacterium]